MGFNLLYVKFSPCMRLMLWLWWSSRVTSRSAESLLTREGQLCHAARQSKLLCISLPISEDFQAATGGKSYLLLRRPAEHAGSRVEGGEPPAVSDDWNPGESVTV